MTRGALIGVNGDDKELQELTQRLPIGKKILKDGVVGEENGLHDKNELQVNGIVEEFKIGQGETVKGPVVSHVAKQQTQGEVVCWERFLHLRSLKVLLVENDNSTGHVVTALLRNCCYEGIGLLRKITSHQTRKNISVTIFKYLSKGAVDFLVKPIRKNKLKNLWRHVWNRCHSSSGSGSESGSQTEKSVKSKSLEKSGNNTYSNDEDNNRSEDLNNRNGSDNGSGTQLGSLQKVMHQFL